MTEQLLLLETHVDMLHVRRPAAAFYPGDELGSDASNWWGPNVPACEAMLRVAGFSDVQVKHTPPPLPRRLISSIKRRNRDILRYDRAVLHARH